MKIVTLAITAGPLVALALPALASTRGTPASTTSATARHGAPTRSAPPEGQINRPARIWVNVHADPDQKVDVYWNIDCFKGLSSSSNDGNFTARTPV